MKKRLNFLKDKPLVIILGIALLLLFILGLTSGCTKENMNSSDNKDKNFGKIEGERPNRSDLPPNFSRTENERPDLSTENERPDLSNMTVEEMEELRKSRSNPTEGMSPEELEEFRSNGMEQEN